VKGGFSMFNGEWFYSAVQLSAPFSFCRTAAQPPNSAHELYDVDDIAH
jgi:hypothetical protein